MSGTWPTAVFLSQLARSALEVVDGLGDGGERDVCTDDVIAAIARTVPLSKSQREVIERLRSWLREVIERLRSWLREVIERLRSWLRDGRAQSASSAAASLAAQAQVRLELN